MPARKKKIPPKPKANREPEKSPRELEKSPRKFGHGTPEYNSGDTGLGGRTAFVDDPTQRDPWGPSNIETWGAIKGGSVGTMIGLNTTEGEDLLTDTIKTTAGYFTAGAGTLIAADIHTSSLANSNEKYYFNVSQTHPLSGAAATQFSVAYGHAGGSGSETNGGDVEGPTKAIYGQWASTLLDESEVSGGFRISSGDATKPSNSRLSAGIRDEDVYILVGKRERFKDRINKKNWTIEFSGSMHEGNGKTIRLTDDSNTNRGTGTVAGIRYNIVSGSQGTVISASTARTFGWFYPEMGVMVFSANELSASIPGPTGSINVGYSGSIERVTASFVAGGEGAASASAGFGPNFDAKGNPQNALKFINCLTRGSSQLKFRSEEDQISTSYFCRVRAKDLNFSNNPTFVSGSSNEMSNTDMWGNPNVYITGIGLYNASNDLIAIGKLSTPLKKNFSTESTIKVKLTY
jgi:hypothetical protein